MLEFEFEKHDDRYLGIYFEKGSRGNYGDYWRTYTLALHLWSSTVYVTYHTSQWIE